MKKFLIFVAALFNLIPLFAVDKKPKKITIGFSIDTIIVERWTRDIESFKKKALDYDADVIVVNAVNDSNLQVQQINELIKQKVDVLVIVAKDYHAVSSVIRKANKKKIPVISYDRLILDADIDLYLSIDCFTVGTIMADELLKVCPSGNFFAIYGSEDDYNMILVDKGVHSVLDKSSAKLTQTYFTPDWNYDLSYSKVNELLDNNSIPDAIICGNDAIAETVIKAISEKRLDTPVFIAGQDADILACKRVIAGTQVCTVYKPIQNLASKACEYAYGLASKNIKLPETTINNGLKNVPVFWLKPQAVNKYNIDDIVIKSGFHTKEEIYN